MNAYFFCKKQKVIDSIISCVFKKLTYDHKRIQESSLVADPPSAPVEERKVNKPGLRSCSAAPACAEWGGERRSSFFSVRGWVGVG